MLHPSTRRQGRLHPVVSHRLAIYHELRDSVGLSSTYYARDPRGCAAATAITYNYQQIN